MKLDEKLLLANEKPGSLEKKFYVLGVIGEALAPHGIKPILVGGTAVEFYTLGGYATKDIDLVLKGREIFGKTLLGLGFEKITGERHWYHPGIDVAIEVPDSVLAGDNKKVVEVEMEGMVVNVIGIEDLILDRLAAYKFWESTGDGEWAQRLMLIHFDTIDWTYLREVGAKNGLGDALDEIIVRVEALRKQLKEAAQ